MGGRRRGTKPAATSSFPPVFVLGEPSGSVTLSKAHPGCQDAPQKRWRPAVLLFFLLPLFPPHLAAGIAHSFALRHSSILLSDRSFRASHFNRCFSLPSFHPSLLRVEEESSPPRARRGRTLTTAQMIQWCSLGNGRPPSTLTSPSTRVADSPPSHLSPAE